MRELAIDVQGLGKRYRLGELEAFATTLKETLQGRFRRRVDHRDERAEIWALRDIDLQLSEGDVVGIIGRNGSGKSTLLKVLARITEPTVGVSRTRGRVGALLEVGTGFHHELTGRENVYLGGALIGMRRAEIARRFDEIVAFAGVERFIDTPLKRYSSGMSLRLAFAVAAHLEPEIVVVDEVLAVGDAEFQKKCLGRMSELRHEGRTVVFVSHDLGAVARLCPRVLWLEEGRIRADGPAADVIDDYLQATVPRGSEVLLRPTAGAAPRAASVSLIGEDGSRVTRPAAGERLAVRVAVEVADRTPGLDLAVWVVDGRGHRLVDEALCDDAAFLGALDGPGSFEATVELPPILPAGEYVVGLWLGTSHDDFLDEPALRFDVRPALGERMDATRRVRLVQPEVRWAVSPLRSAVPRL